MRIFIRVDASYKIGTGHVMRCLTLANTLKDKGADITFICRQHKGHLQNIIKDKGFKCELLAKAENLANQNEKNPQHSDWLGVSWQQDASETKKVLGNEKPDWLIVDHYGIDYRWHHEIRGNVKKILVIDDLADRKLDCDVLLDQNYYLKPDSRYKDLVHSETVQLLGPKYALLRNEFMQVVVKNCDDREKVGRIFVFMGGSDPTNETEKVLDALEHIDHPNLIIDVVTSSSNPKHQDISAICSGRRNYNFHIDVRNISELMNSADLAIGAGGATTLERCFIGLPSIVIVVAENQKETTQSLSDKGAIRYLGWHSSVVLDDIRLEINNLIARPAELVKMCEISRNVMGKESYYGVNGVVSELLGSI